MSDERRLRYHTRWLDEEPRRHIPVPLGFRPPGPPPSDDSTPPGATGGRGALAPPPPRKTGTPAWVGIAYAACAVTVVVGAVAGPGSGKANVSGALIITPILFGITMMIARRLADADGNPQVVPIIMGGLSLKVVGSVLKFSVSSNVYGTGDFFDYDKWGRRIASGLHHGQYIHAPGRFAGTNFIRLVTGVIYAVSPAEILSGFIVYGWLSFLGVLFFWRAYRIALSSRNDLKYLTWLVLVPTLIYWPSSIGKDAWMVFTMGIASYGAACLFAHRLPRGITATTIGFAGMCMVRPHIALVACGGLILAVLVRRNRGSGSRILSIVFVLLASFVVVRVASSFFGIQAFNRTSIQAQINDTSAITGQGGSAFTPVTVNSPVNFPLAAVTVLYRPFPFEAHSVQEMITAIEGVVLAILSIRAARRSWQALRRSRDYPYFMYALGALLVFIVAFSGFSNFGLLARERAVIQPLFFVFLTLPENIDVEFPKWKPEPLAVPDFRR